ncbi:MAG: aldehyde dehydrogenase [Flavobacteriales bacterium]|nr:aldehyde dehydrogenase [Flavobacteriales bacterium]
MSDKEGKETGALEEILARQRKFFQSGSTKDVDGRLRHLRTLERLVQKHSDDIFRALREDLGKSEFEAFGTEVLIVLKELEYFIGNLHRLSEPQRVDTPPFFAIATSEIHYQPYGQVLILSPWNYPIQLTLTPIVGALAAGNTVVAKPSELAPASAALLEKLLHDHFPPELVYVVNGGVDVARRLLEWRWDYIFFTGSTAVGRLVYEAAARHLTPVTLELGGKSPCVVHHDADLKVAARRIVWGKTVNAGQTCVAPDYILVHRKVMDSFIQAWEDAIRWQYPPSPLENPYYPRIINQRHYERLCGYLAQGRIISGGKTREETLQIEPTILADCPPDAAVMKDEVFGPVMPLLAYSEEEEVMEWVQQRPDPLAFYIFTRNRTWADRLLEQTRSGGACVNECLLHLANHRLPFGGVGNSGLGRYHGPFSFDTFSHKRAVMRRAFFPDLPQRYPPYNKLPMGLVKKFLRKLV